MNKQLQSLFERVSAWPQEDQEELVAAIREIEARQTGVYVLSDDERAAVEEGLAAAERGDFVPDEEMAEFFRRHKA